MKTDRDQFLLRLQEEIERLSKADDITIKLVNQTYKAYTRLWMIQSKNGEVIGAIKEHGWDDEHESRIAHAYDKLGQLLASGKSAASLGKHITKNKEYCRRLAICYLEVEAYQKRQEHKQDQVRKQRNIDQLNKLLDSVPQSTKKKPSLNQ